MTTETKNDEELAKADMDMLVYGNSSYLKADDGAITHIPVAEIYKTTEAERRSLMARALDCSPDTAYWPPAEILDAMWRFREKYQYKEFTILCHWLMRLMNV